MEKYKAFFFAKRKENDFTVYSFNQWRLTLVYLSLFIFDNIMRFFLFDEKVYIFFSILLIIIVFLIPVFPLFPDLLRSKEKRIVKKPRGEREIWLKLPTKK